MTPATAQIKARPLPTIIWGTSFDCLSFRLFAEHSSFAPLSILSFSKWRCRGYNSVMTTTNFRTRFLILFGLVLFSLPQSALAGNWSANLGYNNPPGSTIGLNFMDLGPQWAFEVGVGEVQQQSAGNTTTTSVLGDLNFKYLFSSSGLRPYLQLGAGSSASVTSNSGVNANVGVGGLFGGVGFMAVGQRLYLYMSVDTGFNGGGFFQGGLGYNF